MKASITVFLLSISAFVAAQPYVEGGKTRHRFAQLNAGLDVRTFLPGGSQTAFLQAAGSVETAPFPNQTETRLIIGGTHFWGHADFYIAFPVASFGRSGLRTGPETGAKFFPWRIEHKKIRPYVGVAWLPASFRQGEGVRQLRHTFPLTAGCTYDRNNHLLEIGAGFNYDNRRAYYIGQTTAASIRTPPFWLSVGYKFMLETTGSAEQDWQSGRTKQLTDTLAKLGRLNGFTFAVGPSAAIFIKDSPHNELTAPYLDQHKIADIFPEFGAGYYLHQADLQLNVAFRNISSTMEAYGHRQSIYRQAWSVEVCKFFADYHGFAPFAGPGLSHERLRVRESGASGNVETQQFKGWKPGITFGWDIRPNRLQAWYLRTNLRWFPNLNVRMADGKNVSFDQLEFNFIQLVVFPGRLF